MGSQNHIVQKLTVEIGLSAQENAYALQTKISDGQKHLLLEVMEEIFNRHIGENEIISVNKIELDLGHITPEHLDYEFPEKLKKEAEQVIVSLLHELHQSPGEDAEVRINTSSGTTMTVQASLKHKSVSLIGALAHYLEYGTLPWGNDGVTRPSLRSLVSEAMEKNPEQLKFLLRQFANKPYVFRRLALQLPEEQQQYLASIAGCGFSAKLPGFLADIQRIIEQLLEHRSNSRIVGAQDMKTFIRQEALRFFALNHSQASASSPGAETSNVSGGSISFSNTPEVFFLCEMIDKALAHFRIKVFSEVLRKSGKNFSGPSADSIQKLLQKIVAEEKLASKEKKKTPGGKNGENDAGEKIPADLKNNPGNTTGKKAGNKDSNNRSAAEKSAQEFLESIDGQNLPLAPDAEGGLYIENAGMVILATYLPAFFTNAGLVENRKFTSDAAKSRAVNLLQWLVYGDDENAESPREFTEHDLILNKLLCGIDIAEPVSAYEAPGEKEKEAGIAFLQAVIGNWETIKRSSIYALRTTFLQKKGRLTASGIDWDLFIQRDSAVDTLIDRLPWSVSMIKLPWNKGVIYVEW